MPKTYRKERLNERFWQEINSIVMFELSDPRVADISVSMVDVAPDLSAARVYIAPLYEDVEHKTVLKGLEAAQGYIRSQLAQRIKIRHIPELVFKIDQSFLQARRVDAILSTLPPAATPLPDSKELPPSD